MIAGKMLLRIRRLGADPRLMIAVMKASKAFRMLSRSRTLWQKEVAGAC